MPRSTVDSNTKAEPMALRQVYGNLEMKKPRIAAPLKAASPAASDFTGRTFGGALIYATPWADMSITEVPYGLYDLTIDNAGVTRQVKYQGMCTDWMSGALRMGKFYGIRNITMMGALVGVATEVVDMSTWTESTVFADVASYGKLPSSMTYDMTSGDIYGLFYNEDLSGLNWTRYNTKTLEPEVICRFGGRFNVIALASVPDGSMYAISADGDLYTVNKANARVSLVGHTGVNVVPYTQSMTWDSKTNTLLWAAVTATGSALYSLDPAVPHATLIKRLSEGEQFASIYFTDQEAMEGAPKMPTSLKWNFSSPAAADGNITFTVPSAGDLTVYLDGDKVKDGEKISAGATVTVPFSSLENRTHHVAAVVKNAKGWSPVAESFRYVGLDVPKPVTDLKFEVEDGTATLTWTAPTEGVENGYLDPAKLAYNIYRLPEEELVASNHRSTTFSETLPQVTKRYAYRVIPTNGPGKEGQPTLSNSIIFGEAYELPYTDNFDTEGCLDVYQTIDGDGDGYSWNMGANNLVQASVTYGDNIAETNDWLLSPKMKLEAGNLYRVTAHVRNTWAGSPDIMAMGYCDGTNESVNGITEVKRHSVNTPSKTLLDHDAEFSVPRSGQYKVALGMLSPKGTGGGIFMSQLRVVKVGALTSPSGVTDLAVTPDANGLPKGIVSFTAPRTAIDGGTLSGTLTANIYRDGDLSTPVGTLTAVNPGATVSWEENTNPAPGNHTYTVRMSNNSGEGMDVSAKAFIGIYTAPYSQSFASKDAMEDFQFKTVGFEDNPLNSEMSWNEPNEYSGDPASIEVTHYNADGDQLDMYIVFPVMKFDDESVYRLSFDFKSGNYSANTHYEITYGTGPEPADQVNKAFDVPINTSYAFQKQEGLIALPQGGRYYIALHLKSVDQWDYTWVNLSNISIEYEGSALAPDVVTDLVATSDLTSKLTMKAPEKDYAGRALQELGKIEVYRAGTPLPVHTFEHPAIGGLLEWIDENAILGANSYSIVPINSHGRGNAVTVKSFIGYDEPVAPAQVAIVPSPDNQSATISWDKPRRGVNGGVLNEDEMTFNLVRFYPATTTSTAKFDLLRQGITETSIVPDREPTDKQELIYYGIATVTPQGTSDPLVYFTILGKPYSVPFTESFNNGEAATGSWINTGANALQAMPTSGDLLEYNGFPNVCQDGDNGVFLFLNGAISENPLPFAVLSPKIDLGTAEDPVVSFWLYKGNQSGACVTNPSLATYASADESDFRELGREVWTETSPSWVECRYPLSQFVGSKGAIIFEFVATMGMMSDIILLDNFRVDDAASIDAPANDFSDFNVFGVKDGILTRGAAGSTVRVYSSAGLLLDSYPADDRIHGFIPGIYMVSLSGRTFKVVVR